MNLHRLGKVNLRKNSRQYIHTCCFETELRMCVLKITVLQKKLQIVIFKDF